jgi:hypothetical protein
MRRSLSVAGGLILAVVLSQFPEYAQQYQQRLGGAVDELHVITADFDNAATGAGLTRDEALARYAHAPDAFIAGRGTNMAATFARYAQLSAALARMRGADPWQRLRLLPAYFDGDIAERTLDDFKPALPVTEEGLLYAGAGFLLGYLATSVLFLLAVLPFRRSGPKRWKVTV